MEIIKVAHLKGHTAGIFSLEQSTNPGLIYSGSSDKILAEWSLESFRSQNFSVKTESFIYSCCYIKDKNLLIIGLYSGGIHIIDLEKKKEIKYFTFHQQPVFDIKFCSKNNCFYVLSGDGSFTVWDSDNLSLKNHIILCKEKLRNIDFNLQGTMACIACGDGFLRIFDTEENKKIKEINAHGLSANCVKFHPDGKTLVSGGRDAHLRFWGIPGDFRMYFEIPAHNYAIYGIVFSPDGKFFATASRDKTVKVWDSENLKIIARLDRKNYNGHSHSVNKLLWVNYNNYLISGSDDRTIIVWQVKN